MREFDFDELDRAVHSVLGTPATPVTNTSDALSQQSSTDISQSKSQPELNIDESEDRRISSHAIHARVMPTRRATRQRSALRTHQESTLNLSIQQKDEMGAAKRTPATTIPSVPIQAPSNFGPQPRPRPLARRRSGKVMDIVHPATSSKPVEKSFPAVPVASLGTEDGRPTLKTVDLVPPAPTPVSKDTLGVPKQEAERSAPSLEGPREPTKPPESSADSSDVAAFSLQDMLQDTPFVSDAQVQKRPLGGVSKPAAAPAISSKNTPDTPQGESTDDMQEKIRQIESMDFSSEPEQQVLSADLGSVSAVSPEASVVTTANTTAAADSRPVLFETAPKRTPSAANLPSGPTSITRQYKAEPRVASADDTSPIFDPESYHQPLEHEPARKSGLGLVIGITLLIVLGVGAAVFLWWAGVLPVPL